MAALFSRNGVRLCKNVPVLPGNMGGNEGAEKGREMENGKRGGVGWRKIAEKFLLTNGPMTAIELFW